MRPRERGFSRTPLLVTICAGLLLFSTMLAGPVLVLKDGRQLKGTDLRREDDLYILQLASGAAIPVPSAAVKEVAWVAEGGAADSGAPSGPVANMVVGRTDQEQREAEALRAQRDKETADWKAQREAEQRQAAEQKAQEEKARQEQYNNPYGQGAVSSSGGVVLAGPDIRPPTAAEQLAVFGGPSKWPPDIGHFDLGPSYWVPDPDQANWAPSEFQKPPRDSTWVPTDGFAKTGS